MFVCVCVCVVCVHVVCSILCVVFVWARAVCLCVLVGIQYCGFRVLAKMVSCKLLLSILSCLKMIKINNWACSVTVCFFGGFARFPKTTVTREPMRTHLSGGR